MNFYRTFNKASTINPFFTESLDQAKQTAALFLSTDQRHLIRVELVDINVDKNTLCLILNNGKCDAEVLKTWRLTARGELAEIENGE